MTATLVQKRLKILVRVLGAIVGVIGMFTVVGSLAGISALILTEGPFWFILWFFLGVMFLFGIWSIRIGWKIWRDLSPGLIESLCAWLFIVGAFTLSAPLGQLIEWLDLPASFRDPFSGILVLVLVVGWPTLWIQTAAAISRRLFPNYEKRKYRFSPEPDADRPDDSSSSHGF
ncbi:MAG: hypothetical protein KDN20_13570 [Verrucomicrobiae bacterium]|nr:hypothetical protein [Verrucomicrobiae bacterium]